MAPEFRQIRAGQTQNGMGYIGIIPPLGREELPALSEAVGRTPNNFHGATEIITRAEETLETATKAEAFLRSIGVSVLRDYNETFTISCNDTETLTLRSLWEDPSKRSILTRHIAREE